MTDRELAELLRRNPDLTVDDPPYGGRGKIDAQKSVTISPPLITSEHDLQKAIIAECDRRSILRVEYGNYYAVPNGGHRHPAVAAKLKAEGVKPGIFDLCWYVARHGYNGLYLELKIGDNKPTQEQLEFKRRAQAEGYRCVIVWDSVEAAMCEIELYLEG